MNIQVPQPLVTAVAPMNGAGFYPARQFVISNSPANKHDNQASNLQDHDDAQIDLMHIDTADTTANVNDNDNTNDCNNQDPNSDQIVISQSRWTKDHRIQLKQLMSSLPAADIGAALRVILDTYGVEASKLLRRGMTVELDLTDITDDFILDNLWNYCASVQYNQQLLAAQQQIHNAELQQQLTLQQHTIEQQQIQAQLAAAHHYNIQQQQQQQQSINQNTNFDANSQDINLTGSIEHTANINVNTNANVNHNLTTSDVNTNADSNATTNTFPTFDITNTNSTHGTQEFTMLKLEPLSHNG